MTDTDTYQDIRDAVRALCAQFPDEYHRKVDEQLGQSMSGLLGGLKIPGLF